MRGGEAAHEGACCDFRFLSPPPSPLLQSKSLLAEMRAKVEALEAAVRDYLSGAAGEGGRGERGEEGAIARPSSHRLLQS